VQYRVGGLYPVSWEFIQLRDHVFKKSCVLAMMLSFSAKKKNFDRFAVN